MEDAGRGAWNLTERDLEFVVEAAAPQFADKGRLRQLMREDETFRKGLVGDDRVFAKVMADDNVMIRISPGLYFEILLRQGLKELQKATHTLERTGSQAIPVFDTREVLELFGRRLVLEYLADMLSSFTKIESYVIPVRVRKGIWRKTRFNDLDIDSLIKVAEAVDDEQRLRFFKRIADVCLFISGVFPEYARLSRPSPLSGGAAQAWLNARKGLDDYEQEGRRFYRLAAEHHTAELERLSEVFWLLHSHFNAARKPLTFITEHYLRYKKRDLFGVEQQN